MRMSFCVHFELLSHSDIHVVLYVTAEFLPAAEMGKMHVIYVIAAAAVAAISIKWGKAIFIAIPRQQQRRQRR